MKQFMLILGLVVVLCFGSMLVRTASAQKSASTAQVRPDASAWMREPTDQSSPDPVSTAALRFARDNLWDKAIGDRERLSPHPTHIAVITGGSYLGEPEEIPVFADRAVLIGTFQSNRSVLSASGRSIYAEVTIGVQHVFEDVSGHASAGAPITLIFAGGTVKTVDGEVISFLTQPHLYFPQPNRTYLLVLGYDKSGDFYTFAKDWDLSTGVAKLDSELDIKREREGRSTFIGMTTDELTRVLDNRFATAK